MKWNFIFSETVHAWVSDEVITKKTTTWDETKTTTTRLEAVHTSNEGRSGVMRELIRGREVEKVIGVGEDAGGTELCVKLKGFPNPVIVNEDEAKKFAPRLLTEYCVQK